MIPAGLSLRPMHGSFTLFSGTTTTLCFLQTVQEKDSGCLINCLININHDGASICNAFFMNENAFGPFAAITHPCLALVTVSVRP